MSDVPASLFVLDLIPTSSLGLGTDQAGPNSQDFSQILRQQFHHTSTRQATTLLPVATIESLEELVIYELPQVDFFNGLPPDLKPVSVINEISQEFEEPELVAPLFENIEPLSDELPAPSLVSSQVAVQLFQAATLVAPPVVPGGKELPVQKPFLPQPSATLRVQGGSSRATLLSLTVEQTPVRSNFTVPGDQGVELLPQELPARQTPLPSASQIVSVTVGEPAQPADTQTQLPTLSNIPDSRTVISTLKAPLLPNLPPQEQQTWQTELSQRIFWMTENKTPVATLRLNPPELGLVEVRVSVSQDQAAVSFATSSPEVRSAIEAALPRLQGLFQQNGMDLSHTDVGQHGESRAGVSEHGNRPEPSGSESDLGDHEPVVESQLETNRLLDVFI